MKLKWIGLIFISFLILIIPPYSITQTREPGRIYKIAILPFIIHSQENLDYLREGIYDILSSRIMVEGRIIVIERSLIEKTIYEERPIRLDEAIATRIGMRVGADFVVLGSLTKIGNYISLDARLLSVTEEKPPLSVYTQHKGIDDVMVKIGDFAQEIGYKIWGRRAMVGRPAEPKSSIILQPKREIGRLDQEGLSFKKSETFGFGIKGLDIGDVDGDKRNEIVVMDDYNLYIFKYDGERLTLFQKIEAGNQHNFLTLDVSDVNRNGYAEIIVTSVVEDDLRSFILEFEEGRFKKITEKAGWFFRVLEHPKEGPILMGQKRGADGLPSDPIYRMVWKKRSFEKGPKMPFPKETNIFGVAIADIRGSGRLETITFDEFERLNIFAEDGKVVWRSREKFGGTTTYYETLRKKPDAFRPQEAPAWRVYIAPRILIRDLDGDGIYEVIVNRNESSTGTLFRGFRIYEKGEIYNLVWDENDLRTNWKTREIKADIADFQIRDVDNDGNEELVVAAIPFEEGASGYFSRKSKSNIFFFKLF